MAKCGRKCEIWSRSVGYFRPVAQWNVGKRQEFKDRKTFTVPDFTNNIKSEKKEDNNDGKQQ
jgi:ribonucleoside-triphosphate reductase